jgi:hypothetical protein
MTVRGGGHVKRVARVAVSGEFAVDPCASLQGMGQGFKNDHTASLADDEAVTVAVEWPTRPFRLIVTL